jgi:hypothetical protein
LSYGSVLRTTAVTVCALSWPAPWTNAESSLLAVGHRVYPASVISLRVTACMPITPSRYQLAGAAIACILFVPTLQAQTSNVDVGKMTCKEFAALPTERVSAVTTWLDGYYTEEDDPKLIEFDAISASTEKLISFCKQNPNATVLSASESVFK